ncbi:MAG TPA: potassium-transporting ATPase subunit KdpA [Terriglobales bacterium]|jgi:K+-transporting ATPase ATPase A chain|nr:potassium-transporting ATPase subunit KdpA [Terriglobales bacterium]
MTWSGVAQILIFFAIVLAITKPIGTFMYHVFEGQRTFLHPAFRPLERLIYRLGAVREDVEQSWVGYSASLISFSVFSFLAVYLLQRLQGHLPLNPMQFSTAKAPSFATPITPDLAFNTAVSFMTNTNWQSYSPDTTMSYLTQMAALAVQNFVSAAVGIAVAVALIRGFARHTAKTIGNFWLDVTRCTLYVLLPIAIVAALLLVGQGCIQNFRGPVNATTLEGATQVIEQGPLASQLAIKMLGTNGGGFFNANSSHPYENPTPLSNLLQMLLIFCLGAGLTYTFGKMVRDTKQGWALFGTMATLFFIGVFVCYWAEQRGNPMVASAGLERTYTGSQPGGNMEGKEVRFGIAQSALFATVTTDASSGAVNSMHDSFTPIGGLVPLFNIQTDEVIFGGVGAGLYSMLIYAVIAVFIGGLMVGRTPEYVGKKIEQKEVKMAIIAVLATSLVILGFTALSSIASFAKGGYWNSPGAAAANTNNNGAHGFSEILYAYSSGAGNNGSAFAGINANTPWYNLTMGLDMLVGRFLFIVPALAIAGSLASKKLIPVTSGTLPTNGSLFVVLLIGTIVIVGALTYFPALSLGPIVEHFQMLNGKLF